MMKRPKISVIIPVKDSEKTLRRCISSILEQTYKNYEVLVIDNNSKDRSKSIVKHFQKKNKKIRYLFERRIGRSYARNKGIENSKGHIIAMTDSDCIVPSSWLETLTRPIIENDENAVMGFEEEIKTNIWSKGMQDANKKLNDTLRVKRYIKNIDTKNFVIKKEIIRKELFNTKIRSLEDFELFLRLDKKIKIRYVEDCVIKHLHKTSLLKLFKQQYSRGHSLPKIKKIHKKEEHLMFESLSFINFLKFPFWILIKIIKKPKEGIFHLFSEIGWRFGIISYYLKKIT